MNTIKPVSCGFFIYRKNNNNETELLMVKGITSGKWGPPKGRNVPNEKYIETALREVKEEIGIDLSNYINMKNIRYVKAQKYIMYRYYFDDYMSNNIDIKLQKSELLEYKWFNVKDLNNIIKENPDSFINLIRNIRNVF